MGTVLGIGSSHYCSIKTWVSPYFSIYWEKVLTALKQEYIFALFSLSDGSEIATSTLMGFLLMNDFKLVINKITYDVQCPKQGKKHSYATVLTFPCRCGTFIGR